jgi:hypothetical protein
MKGLYTGITYTVSRSKQTMTTATKTADLNNASSHSASEHLSELASTGKVERKSKLFLSKEVDA